MRHILKINNKDFSLATNKYSISVNYQAVEGSNSGTMLDGTKTIDLLGYRTVISIDTNDISQDKLHEMLTELLKPYVEVTYFDVMNNDTRTSTFLTQVGTIPVAMYKGDNLVYYGKTSITLTERSLHE